MIAFRKRKASIDRDTFGWLFRLYMGEIAYVDHAPGLLLSGLAERGLNQNTIVIVTADHGEEFGDHRGFEHGHTFYDELVHVPLLLHVPRAPVEQLDLDRGSKRLATAMGQIDLAPTLCEMIGLTPPEAFRGQSLLAWLKAESSESQALRARSSEPPAAKPNRPGPPAAKPSSSAPRTAELVGHKPRAVLCQSNMWTLGGVAWIKGGFKLIQNTYDGPFQLYDLRQDPREQTDLAGQQPDRVEAMLARMRETLVRLDHDRPQELPELSDQDRERLRSLGYIR